MIKSVATSFEISLAAEVQSLNFNRWLTDFAYGALSLKGFFSAEIIPPDLAPSETEQEQKLSVVWSVIHRFDSEETCSVGVVSFICMPALVKQFTWWLLPNAKETAQTTKIERNGTTIVLAMFLLEVVALSYLVSVIK
jgi:hypothetical protein